MVHDSDNSFSAEWDDDQSQVSASGFVPATDKFEAVNRLSRAAGGGAETLGPGSKERKSVLVTVARSLNLDPSVESLAKPELGRVLAGKVGARWDEACWSTGSTVTLEGLNRILEGVLVHLTKVPSESLPNSSSPVSEANEILKACLEALPWQFDGRSAIETLLAAESRNWAQSEWPGFYFEHLGISACVAEMGGAPVATPGRTKFDYGLDYIWDFKCHSDDDPWAILNDQEAIHWALKEGGLGFIVLEGEAKFEPDFANWHRQFKIDNGVAPRPRAVERSYVRKLKSSFDPHRLSAFWFPNGYEWQRAVMAAAVKEYKQGQQVTGAARRPKYQLNLEAASPWIVAHRSLR